MSTLDQLAAVLDDLDRLIVRAEEWITDHDERKD